MKRSAFLGIMLVFIVYSSIVFAEERLLALGGTFEGCFPTGICVDIAKAVLDKAGIPYEIKQLPWVRIEKRSNEPNIIILPRSRNSENENKFIWIGNIFPTCTDNNNYYMALTKTSSSEIANKLIDAYKYVIQNNSEWASKTKEAEENLKNQAKAKTTLDDSTAELKINRELYTEWANKVGSYIVESKKKGNISPEVKTLAVIYTEASDDIDKMKQKLNDVIDAYRIGQKTIEDLQVGTKTLTEHYKHWAMGLETVYHLYIDHEQKK